MKKLIFSTLFLAIGMIAALAPTAHAVAGDEKIDNFKSSIVITKDNVAKITEEITYDFGATEHHGIYRDIPIDYHDGNTNYYVNVRYAGTVDKQGSTVQSETNTENGNYRIRLGDPDVTVSGLKTYKISYELFPIVIKNNNVSFLTIDAVGTGWQVPINKASVSIRLEGRAEFSNTACFYGAQGSNMPCQDSDGLKSVKNYTVGALNPYEGISINAKLPSGYVAQYLEPNKMRTSDIIAVIVAVCAALFGVLIAIVVMAFITMRWWRVRSLRKKQIVVAQYNPPDSLSPAEIGYLSDDSSDMAEITATLIDFAVRGYVKITQQKVTGITGIFGGQDYVLTCLRDTLGLSQSEIALHGAFFLQNQEVKLSNLSSSTLAVAVSNFKTATKKSLEGKGFYSQGGSLMEKGTLTESGAKEWALVDGFKLFLTVVEKDRLAFSDAPSKTPERFSKLLPYAIALGVEKEWAKQFEGIDISPSTGWYSGSNLALFSAASLTSDLNSGFASAVSSNSTVSSSGGSSGGGFGGGGGGSW